MIATRSILDEASEHIFDLFSNGLSEGHLYHTYKHTYDTVAASQEIGKGMKLGPDDLEIVSLAGWFHDAGHVATYEGHEQKSTELATSFLRARAYPEEKIERVVSAILATRYPQHPKNLAEAVLCDADMMHLGQKNYIDYSTMLREELHRRLQKEYSDVQWIQMNIDFLTNHRFHTPFARDEFDKQRVKNIGRLQKRLREVLIEQPYANGSEKQIVAASGNGKLPKKMPKPADSDALKKLKESKPERGVETMFRTTGKNHLDLSGMADSKANILLSVSSLVISIIVTTLIRKLEESPYLVLPTVILLVVCVTTVVFATLATRPQITSGKFTRDDIMAKKVNLLFFGNFYNVSLEDYEWGMWEMMNDRDYLYSTMVKDIHSLGLVLARKYKYIRIAYTVFMYGLLISVLAYVVAFLLAPSGTVTPDLLAK